MGEDKGEGALGDFQHPDLKDVDFSFKLAGNVMSPLVSAGDLVFVKMTESNVGDLVCFADERGALQVRWLRDNAGATFLISENPSYPALPIGTQKILGKVVGSVKLHMF